MGNLVLYSETIDNAALAVTSAATGHAKELLQDRLTNTSWKGSSSANQNIDIDWGAAKACDHLVLLHNIPVSSVVDIFYASASNYSDAVSVSSGAGWTIIGTGIRTQLCNFAASHTARYWRVQITSQSAASEIYLAFIGAKLDISIRYNQNWMDRKIYNGNILVETLGGKRYSRRLYGGRQRIEYTWEYLDLTNQNKLQTLIANSLGNALPFFLKRPDDTFLYCRLNMPSIDNPEIEYQLYNLGPLIFEEEF
jgi:hypothetical protein